jgi:hypothetical protein
MRQGIGGMGADRVKEHFMIDGTVTKIEEVYRNVMLRNKSTQYAKEGSSHEPQISDSHRS